jgi:hypothetical protein
VNEAPPAPQGLVVALGVDVSAAAQLVGDVIAHPSVVDATGESIESLDSKWASSSWDVIAVVAEDVGALRRAAPLFDSLGTAPTVVLQLLRTPISMPAPHRGVTLPTDVRVTTGPAGAAGVRVAVVAAEPLRPRLAVAWVATPGVLTRASGLRITAGDNASLSWCVDEPDVQTLPVTRRIGGSAEIAPDVLVTTTEADAADIAARAVANVSQRCPPVDSRVVNPGGFTTTEFVGQARFEQVGDGVVLRLSDDTVVGDLSGRLSASDIAALRPLRHVRLENAAERNLPAQRLATLLVHLAAAGIPTITHTLPADVAAMIHPDLVSALEAARPMETAEELTREAVSVRQRRAALRRHDPAASWDRLRADLGYARGAPTKTSVLLVTRRPYFLDHAMHTMATQQNADMEVVLVTHGFTLNATEIRQRSEQCGHPLTVLTADNDMPLGATLNLAAGAAAGDVVTKMDDDDWYGPHHVEDVTKALAWSGATVVGVQALYTYLVNLDITVHGPDSGVRETIGRRAPGPTMTFRKSDLLQLGGFRPLPRYEDLSISLALKRMGGTVHLSHGLGFLRCRHGAEHSWAAGTTHFLRGTTDQWRGFHPPPEVNDDDDARRHLDDVRRRSGDGAPVTTR